MNFQSDNSDKMRISDLEQMIEQIQRDREEMKFQLVEYESRL